MHLYKYFATNNSRTTENHINNNIKKLSSIHNRHVNLQAGEQLTPEFFKVHLNKF